MRPVTNRSRFGNERHPALKWAVAGASVAAFAAAWAGFAASNDNLVAVDVGPSTQSPAATAPATSTPATSRTTPTPTIGAAPTVTPVGSFTPTPTRRARTSRGS